MDTPSSDAKITLAELAANDIPSEDFAGFFGWMTGAARRSPTIRREMEAWANMSHRSTALRTLWNQQPASVGAMDRKVAP